MTGKRNKKEMTLRAARERAGLSLHEASERLGITHSYLSALELGHKRLRPEKSEELVDLYKMPADMLLIQPVPEDKENFLAWQRSQIKWWDSRFVLPSVPAVTSSISDLYVSPVFSDKKNERRSSQAVLSQFFLEPDNKALLISGGIGSGKSFFMRQLTLETGKFLKECKSPKKFVPLLVSLGEFSLTAGSLLQSLGSYYKQLGYDGSASELERFLRQCLERGSALLMFDGLDEKQDVRDRANCFALLQRFFSESLRAAGNKMIISGREEAFFRHDCGRESFESLRIAPWQSEQILEACSKWAWNDQAEAHSFWVIIQSNRALYRLARLPLIFHLLTTLYNSHGLLPFQDLAGLYDACCGVLENSWSYARKAFPGGAALESGSLLPAGQTWLKWRRFLVFLMRIELNASLKEGRKVAYTFNAADIQTAWEDFLAESGIERQSLDFARLEGIVLSQEAIGPMFHSRYLAPDKREYSKYSFLDESFGHYYLALALLDDPDNLESLLLHFLRSEEWSQVIALAIQALGRSDRRLEQQKAEKLIDLLLGCDDEFGLEAEHGIGAFGLLTAMRAVGSYSLQRHWDLVVQPFLVLAEAQEDFTSRECWQIISEHSASPLLRRYLHNLYEEVFGTNRRHEASDYIKQRTLAFMACVGQQFEFVVSQYIADLARFSRVGAEKDSVDRVNLRRLFWRLPFVGSLFTLDAKLTSGNNLPKNFKGFTAAIFDVLEYLRQQLEKELRCGRFRGYHYWYVFTVTQRSQYMLCYFQNIKKSMQQLLGLIDKYIDVLFEDYPYRGQMIQYLKVAARRSFMIDAGLRNRLLTKLKQQRKKVSDLQAKDLEVAICLIELAEGTIEENLNSAELYRRVYGASIEDLLRSWIDALSAAAGHDCEATIKLGTAVCGIGEFHDCLADSQGPYCRKAVIENLLKLRAQELSIDNEQLLQEDRCFTRPFTDYNFPIYDHIYNTLVELARDLPIGFEARQLPA